MAIHLFHGSEGYLVELAFKKTWSQLTSGLDSDLDAELLDAGATADDVLVACTSVGFFSPVRIVGIRDWRVLGGSAAKRGKPKTAKGAKGVSDDPVEAAAAMLSSLPDATTLVLSSSTLLTATNPLLKAIQEQGKVMSFPRLRFGEVPAWVAQRAREYSLDIDRRAVDALVRRAGEDLAQLDSELAKLATYAAGQKVTPRDVEALVADSAEHQVWDLTDSLISNPGKAALELDRSLAAGEPAGRLSYMLVRHLRLLLAASAAPGGGAGARSVAEAFAGDGRPLSDYSLNKAISQARGVHIGRLEAIYRRAASAEAAQRRGEMDEETALRLVVMEAALRD
ncbi:MAG: DNA polymerase III subunit delta [Candidatus Dormibacteria bacterium]